MMHHFIPHLRRPDTCLTLVCWAPSRWRLFHELSTPPPITWYPYGTRTCPRVQLHLRVGCVSWCLSTAQAYRRSSMAMNSLDVGSCFVSKCFRGVVPIRVFILVTRFTLFGISGMLLA